MKLTDKLRRRITEVIVIVVSILLAFALEAWWDEQRESREIKLSLNALSDEFEALEEVLTLSIARNEQVISAADSLLSVFKLGAEIVEVYSETLGLLLLTPTTDPRSGTLDALIASGRLDLIENLHLQAQLAKWPANMEDIREEELAAKSFVHEQFIPYLVHHAESLASVFDWRVAELDLRIPELSGTGTIPHKLRQARVKLHVDLQFINLIETRRYLANVIIKNYSVVDVAAEQIRLELEK